VPVAIPFRGAIAATVAQPAEKAGEFFLEHGFACLPPQVDACLIRSGASVGSNAMRSLFRRNISRDESTPQAMTVLPSVRHRKIRLSDWDQTCPLPDRMVSRISVRLVKPRSMRCDPRRSSRQCRALSFPCPRLQK
jgi:hypothetical protein